jgi:hypothetical protein
MAIELASGKMLDLIVLILIWAVTLFLIYSKREIWIRRLPALDFIEESVGRAAEMGRPVVVQGFGSGSSGLQSSIAPQIMAGLAVLGHTARICARHGTQIIAPMRSESVVPVADEVLRTSFRMEGKMEEYEANREEMLPWAPTQAALVAIGLRYRPAAHLMIGAFWHESVQIAEAYGRVGAVQIGGTGRLYQIPFFAAVCDMNLIGEEIYAVGAYINRTQELLSSIATSDIFKVAAMVLMVLGSILATIGAAGPLISFFTW